MDKNVLKELLVEYYENQDYYTVLKDNVTKAYYQGKMDGIEKSIAISLKKSYIVIVIKCYKDKIIVYVYDNVELKSSDILVKYTIYNDNLWYRGACIYD